MKARTVLVLAGALAMAGACEGPTFEGEAGTAGSASMAGHGSGGGGSGGGGPGDGGAETRGGAEARGGGGTTGVPMPGDAGDGPGGTLSSGGEPAAVGGSGNAIGGEGGSVATGPCAAAVSCETCCEELYPDGHGPLASAYLPCGCGEPCSDYCGTDFCTSAYYWDTQCIKCMLKGSDSNACIDAAATCGDSDVCSSYRACLLTCF